LRIVDLAPDRDDGYDLTDWILDGSPNAETIDLGGPINARSDGSAGLTEDARRLRSVQ
jgi:hypothetical protein